MNYETAKKLKDAGFPQHEEETPNFVCRAYGCWMEGETYGYENAHNPSLSELIEACGGDAFLLYRREKNGLWTASSSDGKTDQDDKEGSTPDEAVASLWFALHQ